MDCGVNSSALQLARETAGHEAEAAPGSLPVAGVVRDYGMSERRGSRPRIAQR